MLRKFDLLRTLNNFFSFIGIKRPEKEHAKVEEEIRQLRTELNDTKEDLARVTEQRDKLKERCESLEKQLTETQVVEKFGVTEERDKLKERCENLEKLLQLKEAQLVEKLAVTEELDKLKERCEILERQLEEAQFVNLGKQRTTTFQNKATSPREMEWKGKRRLRISTILNFMRNQGQKQGFEVKLS